MSKIERTGRAAAGASEGIEKVVLFAPEVPKGDRARLTDRPWLLAPLNGPAPTKLNVVAPTLRDEFAAHPVIRKIATTGVGALVLVGGLHLALLVIGINTIPAYSGTPAGPQADPTVADLAWLQLELMALGAVAALTPLLAFGPINLAVAARERRVARHGIHLHGRYLLPELDLDGPQRDLLRRARAAADQITQTSVYADGLLGKEAGAAFLPAVLWGLGQELAGLTRGQREIDAAVKEVGPELNALSTSHRAAISTSFTALATRVSRLEKLARQVVVIDKRRRVVEAAARLDRNLPLDLAANRAVRDAAELAGIEEMAEQLPAVREVVDDEYAALVAQARQDAEELATAIAEAAKEQRV